MGQEPTPSALYAGTFERSLDAKKRVAIPAGWVSGEGEEFHVVPHPKEGYLMVMGREELSRWEQRIQDSPALTPAKKREAIRMFFGAAHAVTADKQGRILLPEKHCESAGLGGEVVFIGARSRFEIWSRDRYEAAASSSLAIYQEAAEAIGL